MLLLECLVEIQLGWTLVGVEVLGSPLFCEAMQRQETMLPRTNLLSLTHPCEFGSHRVSSLIQACFAHYKACQSLKCKSCESKSLFTKWPPVETGEQVSDSLS
jgi:hypothetical protein